MCQVLGALEQLDQTLADSRVCINHWLTRQSRAEDEEKVLLRHIVDRKLPQQMAALKAMDGAWTPAASAHVDTLRQEVDRLRVLYGYIMELLPDFRSYDNPAKVMEAERYAVDGGELERFTAAVQQRLYTLTEAQNESLRQHTTQMDELGNQLAMVAGRVAWFVLILGIVLGVVVTRSIVQPVKELKRALYHMGRGVLPPGDVRVTPDEIGDMALAVNRLSQGLARTQKFSQEVGGGAFNTPYEPLSDDDALGKALLQMRSSLARNERELEGKVQQRTEELAQEKAKVENVLGDLQDSINYALRIQQAILPSDQERREVLSESAVFYQPRDVVSGDFYWFKAVGSRRMFSAIDCTGHGVPGAFLSLVGHNALDRVTKVYTEPHKVLDHLNTHVLALLRKDVQTVASIPDDLVRDLALSVEGVGPAGGTRHRRAGRHGLGHGRGQLGDDDARIRRGQQPPVCRASRRASGAQAQQIRDLLLRAQHQELRRPEVPSGIGRHVVPGHGRVCGPIRRAAWQEVHAPPLPGAVGGNGFVAGDGA